MFIKIREDGVVIGVSNTKFENCIEVSANEESFTDPLALANANMFVPKYKYENGAIALRDDSEMQKEFDIKLAEQKKYEEEWIKKINSNKDWCIDIYPK